MNPLSDEAFYEAYQMSRGGSDADRALRVRFFHLPVPDAQETADKGRPIFRSAEMCEIRVSKDEVVIGQVSKMQPDPRDRFPVQYAKFKRGDTEQIVGTLLSAWGHMDVAEVASYEAIDILTVEQLAGLSDAQCQEIRGSLKDRQRARDFLDMAKGLEPVAQARAENAALRAQIDALTEAVRSLGGKVPDAPAAESPAPKRRGRPPKAPPVEGQEH